MRFPSALLLCGLIAAAPALSAQQTASTTAQNPTPAPAHTTQAAPPPLRLESLPPEPKALTPAQQKALQAKQLLTEINDLARNQANWGPAMSTPGASLTLTDKGHKSIPEGTQVTFILHATGFQPGEAISLLRWPLGQNVQRVATGLTVDGNGQVICPEISQGDCLSSMQPGDPVHVDDVAARGEPLRVALVSANGKKRAESTVIPFPIESTNNGCKLEVILGVKNAEMVLLEGIGFPKSSKVELHIVSFGQDHPVTATTSAGGGLIVADLPAVAGHTSGTTTVSYHGSNCSPSVSFPWGLNSYHPL
jgi:hypothetical protein